jgi:hypothetical protein
MEIRRVQDRPAIVIDEGVCQNFSDSLIELNRQDESAFNHIFINRALIFCHGDLVDIIRQIRARELSGHLMPLHKGLTDDALRDFTNEVLVQMAEFSDLLKKHKVPVLEIQMADSVFDNIAKVRCHIESLSDSQR